MNIIIIQRKGMCSSSCSFEDVGNCRKDVILMKEVILAPVQWYITFPFNHQTIFFTILYSFRKILQVSTTGSKKVAG